ncbi:hypothetical protein CTV99_01895 [Bacillus pumilus]|uniref:Uncharacterized protein n=2 Tax=Bacillus pumilus TaxID=1408 RepID=A0A2G8IY60_BACPU|nr:hypothetical protein CTV99_01895 [Bacillus pumilus]
MQKEKNKFVRFDSVSFLSSRSSIASHYVIEKRKFTFFIYLLISTLNIKLYHVPLKYASVTAIILLVYRFLHSYNGWRLVQSSESLGLDRLCL